MIFDVYPPDNAIYIPGAFDKSIGDCFPVTLDGRPMGHGKLLKAEVAENGKSAKLTLMVDFEN